ncbi:hypothetical protein COV05_01215 [Candidatus Uhrbacteria bacterium CG10_big_fil_rev_8_21_14_0_10_48_16]|uniref:DNA 3'-5' helicase n=1 Tax=Candidatus Uhrbacteria bacterium CG10_big_fil_rev_8_21_14_0_10_48_16 TaxID=1975038 RepID=A0A2M8LHV6_9BACT|nr:MAG: hypothetical protein COV05_01215 [Candidatus Uhrbacteria bacterium CG10_big_fil_rev_8_21_14_0_10_48_16]
MNQEEKDTLYIRAKKHVEHTCFSIRHSVSEIRKSIAKKQDEYKTLDPGEKFIFSKLLQHEETRAYELDHLKRSPFFVKCEITIDGEQKNWYFGKFGHKESDIFSWVTPAAAIRFETPGHFSYVPKDKKIIQGQLHAKDQYMIVDGKILFFTTESEEHPRELIYQEHFSARKTGFVLPEIVAQMERAQDQVIRASHEGPFVISGPAGSGKTTLALHRIAYLVQSPETTERFPPDSIIVFVQDEGTKDYFSHILPELGIEHVTITTFAQWAMKILNRQDVVFAERIGETEEERDHYELVKLKVLQSLSSTPLKSEKDMFKTLEHAYTSSFSPAQQTLFKQQVRERILDRFDLTILLSLMHTTSGALSMMKEYYLELKNGALKKKIGALPIGYSLVVVDEFQNYLPEQIQLMKTCKHDQLPSMVFVGDIAQQIQLGTLKSWSEIGEQIADERLVTLKKVYRNTKEILSFVKSLGYPVHIPSQVKSGKPVHEVHTQDAQEEIAYIHQLAETLEDGQTIGVLSRHRAYLEPFVSAFKDNNSIRVFDIKEAQGVEFDIVCLVGVQKDTFTAPEDHPEKQRILKNLLYIALTRAMSELHILGKEKLKKLR